MRITFLIPGYGGKSNSRKNTKKNYLELSSFIRTRIEKQALNKRRVALLVVPASPLGIEFDSYAKRGLSFSFCFV